MLIKVAVEIFCESSNTHCWGQATFGHSSSVPPSGRCLSVSFPWAWAFPSSCGSVHRGGLSGLPGAVLHLVPLWDIHGDIWSVPNGSLFGTRGCSQGQTCLTGPNDKDNPPWAHSPHGGFSLGPNSEGLLAWTRCLPGHWDRAKCLLMAGPRGHHLGADDPWKADSLSGFPPPPVTLHQTPTEGSECLWRIHVSFPLEGSKHNVGGRPLPAHTLEVNEVPRASKPHRKYFHAHNFAQPTWFI